MENYVISRENLEDISGWPTGHKSYHFWKTRIKNSYPQVLIGHELESEFKFFTCWPATICFYADENNTIHKEPVVVRNRILDGTPLNVNKDRAILLGIFDRDGVQVIRYGLAEHDILA